MQIKKKLKKHLIYSWDTIIKSPCVYTLYYFFIDIKLYLTNSTQKWKYRFLL